MSIFTLAFWRAAGERAVKSVAQGLLVAGIGAAGFNVLAPGTDWRGILGIGLGMGVASLLTSVASDALTAGDGPSLTDAEVLPVEGQHRRDEGGYSALELAVGVLAIVLLVLLILRLA